MAYYRNVRKDLRYGPLDPELAEALEAKDLFLEAAESTEIEGAYTTTRREPAGRRCSPEMSHGVRKMAETVNLIRRLLPRRVKRAIRALISPDDAAADGMGPEPPARLAAAAKEYWTASQAEDDKRDLSHWKGSGRWADEQGWRRIGEDHFAFYQSLLRLADRQAPVRSMLEWGPGGGANAVRFGREIPRFYGVDISEPNLEQCRREVESEGYSGFVPISIDAANPEGVLDRVGEPVDLFLCTAVYQHFPGKEYGVRVTRLAHRLLAEGGVALIQTRYDDGNPVYAPKSSDYRANAIVFTSYTINEFWQLAADAGFRPLAVVLRPATNYAFYLLSKT